MATPQRHAQEAQAVEEATGLFKFNEAVVVIVIVMHGNGWDLAFRENK